MIQLALIRHGITAWNRQGRIQGHTDIPLDADAELDLSQYKLPVQWQDSRVVASPLSRATRTAELLSGQVPEKVPALLEMDWGEWEGRRSVDIAAEPNSRFRHLDEWGWDYRPPGGESPSDVRARAEPWVLSLQGDTVAVCHIGVMRTLLAIAHGWNFEGMPPFVIKRNRLYLLQVSDAIEPGDPSCVRLPPKSS